MNFTCIFEYAIIHWRKEGDINMKNTEEILAESIEGMLICFEKMNLSTEQIFDKIKNLNEIIRSLMHIMALNNGNEDLAERIQLANEMIQQDKINKFKEAVNNGTAEEYLASIDYIDKISLNVEMGLFRTGLESEEPLTAEEQKYADLIEASIGEYLKKQAQSEGFKNVDEWKENNARKANSSDSTNQILLI